MITSDQEVPGEALPERQRAFLDRLRQHDKRVKVVRIGDKLTFHGPVIGDGPMPDSTPAADISDEEEEPGPSP